MPSVTRVRVVRVWADQPDALERTVNDELGNLANAGQEVLAVQFDPSGASAAWVTYRDLAKPRAERPHPAEQSPSDAETDQAASSEFLRQSKERLDRYRAGRARVDEEKERQAAADQELKSMVDAASRVTNSPTFPTDT